MAQQRELWIATDESVPIPVETVKRYSVIVVPRRAGSGRRNLGLADAQKNGGFPRLAPARLDDFLNTYRPLQGKGVVSIHAPLWMDDAALMARRAGGMFKPETDVQVHEAGTFNYGIALLVEAAARFAHEAPGYATPEQVLTLLRRIEDRLHTVILSAGSDLPCAPRLTLLQQIKGLFGVRTPLVYDATQRTMKPLTRRETVTTFAGNADSMLVAQGSWRSPRQATAVQRTVEQTLGVKVHEWSRLRVRHERMGGNYLQVTACPRADEIMAIMRWIRRWGSADRDANAMTTIAKGKDA